MSKPSSDNSEAIKLQRETMAQSAVQNKAMLALLQTQVDNAKTLKLPKAAPPMPLPGASSTDLVAQSQEVKRNLLKRSGLMATHVAPPVMRSALGTPMFDAAAA